MGALLVQPTLLRLLDWGVVSAVPLSWVSSQVCWGCTRCPGCWWSWTSVCLGINPWHTLPLLIQQGTLWDFTVVTQDKIQSLVRQMGIFSMILPMAQWLGSLDVIKLWLAAPICLSTVRSIFKQLSSWLSHRQQRYNTFGQKFYFSGLRARYLVTRGNLCQNTSLPIMEGDRMNITLELCYSWVKCRIL